MSGMRIIGGRYRGRRLSGPRDRAIRPTGARAREALFGMLDHRGLIAGVRFLDLFCGTGMVGLEAFSRGAEEVWLIDRDVATAKANVDALGRPDEIHVRRMDASRLARPPLAFDVAFVDPPYDGGLAMLALAALREGWLAIGATIVVETAAKEAFMPPPGFALEQDRQYGAARFTFLRWPGEEAASGSS